MELFSADDVNANRFKCVSTGVFAGDTVVKNLPSNAGDSGSVTWSENQGPTRGRATKPTCSRACAPQPEKPPSVAKTRKRLHATMKTQSSQK